jgi:hypothetical protein
MNHAVGCAHRSLMFSYRNLLIRTQKDNEKTSTATMQLMLLCSHLLRFYDLRR